MGKWALAAGVLLLAGCGVPANADGRDTFTDSIDGQDVRIDLPVTQPVGVALWFHGRGGDSDTRMNEAWLNALRGQGWAVASSDFHGDAWGDPDTVADAAKLADWASEEAGAEVRLIVAGSMGGLASLNALAAGVVSARCWYGVMPVVDLAAADTVPDAADEVDEALEVAVNPADRLDELPTDVRYRVVASPDDTWVQADEHAAVLVAALSRAGADVTELEATGEHGDPSHFQAEDLAEFAASC